MTIASTQTETKTVMKTPSMWKVVLVNDDFTPMNFVTEVLILVFQKSFEEAMDLMLTVHNKGRANIALYTKEIAVMKVKQVRALAEANGHPLLCIAEEA